MREKRLGKRGTIREEEFCILQPAGGKPRAGDSQKLYQRKFARSPGIPKTRFADDGVCELAASYGNFADVSAAGKSTFSGDARDDSRIPRRLFAARAARDRTRAA